MTNTLASAYAKYANVVYYNNHPAFLIDNFGDLHMFANTVGAREFRVYTFNTETAETSEDPEAQIFGINNLIGWLMKNSSEYITLAHMVDMFDDNGDRLTVFDVVC